VGTPSAIANTSTPASASNAQTFAEVAKADFLLFGAFLLFLGLISTDAYYRAFGLRFQFLTYPWNLIIFRGLLTVVIIASCACCSPFSTDKSNLASATYHL
jgi:hypothetical protein